MAQFTVFQCLGVVRGEAAEVNRRGCRGESEGFKRETQAERERASAGIGRGNSDVR